MSLFGYPATVTHFQAQLDGWDIVTGYTTTQRKAKVVDTQKVIRNAKGEEVLSVAEIHLEGAPAITIHDYFEYTNGLGELVRYFVRHIEPRKHLGSEKVKKVIVYG